MQYKSATQAVIKNLRDAGCNTDQVRLFLLYEKEGTRDEQLKLLASQRQRLLDNVHRDERRIGCLDYLVYQLTKNK